MDASIWDAVSSVMRSLLDTDWCCQSRHSSGALTIATRLCEQPLKSPRLTSAITHLGIDRIGPHSLFFGSGHQFLSAACLDFTITHNATRQQYTGTNNERRYLKSYPRHKVCRHHPLHLSHAIQPSAANTTVSPTATNGSAVAVPKTPFHAPTLCMDVVMGAVGAGIPFCVT